MLHHVTPCYTIVHHVTPSYTMLHHSTPCYTMLHHVPITIEITRALLNNKKDKQKNIIELVFLKKGTVAIKMAPIGLFPSSSRIFHTETVLERGEKNGWPICLRSSDEKTCKNMKQHMGVSRGFHKWGYPKTNGL